ncbi:MAG: hypothetical protein WBE38_15370 [Terracidiphilus sp.]
MKTHDARRQLEVRAAAALKAALGEVSAIKVREIRHEPHQTGRDSSLMVHVELFGRRHALTCAIHSDGQPQHLRSALEELRAGAAQRTEDAMPIIIAPYLSPEAQALCKEHKTGFVDLEGNARLALGEVFIVKRTLPHRGHHRTTMTAAWHPAAQEKIAMRSETPHRVAQLIQA